MNTIVIHIHCMSGPTRVHLREKRDSWPALDLVKKKVAATGCCAEGRLAKASSGDLRQNCFYPRDWRATTVDQFIKAIDSYICWYSGKRIKVSLGSLSPVDDLESLWIAA